MCWKKKRKKRPPPLSCALWRRRVPCWTVLRWNFFSPNNSTSQLSRVLVCLVYRAKLTCGREQTPPHWKGGSLQIGVHKSLARVQVCERTWRHNEGAILFQLFEREDWITSASGGLYIRAVVKSETTRRHLNKLASLKFEKGRIYIGLDFNQLNM